MLTGAERTRPAIRTAVRFVGAVAERPAPSAREAQVELGVVEGAVGTAGDAEARRIVGRVEQVLAVGRSVVGV